MIRSPNNAYSSQPDLSNLRDDADAFVNVRKRKKPEEEDNVNKALNMYTKQIQETLADFKASVDTSIAEIRKDINNDIMSNLSNLSSITSDIRADVNSLRSEYTDVKNSLAAMNSKQEEFVAALSEVNVGMDFSSDRQDKFDKRLEIVEKYEKTHKDNETEFMELKKSSLDLQFQLNEFQQRERMLNLEITGLPELKGEVLTEIMIAIAKHSGVILTNDDIDHVNRVQPRQAVVGRPRAVVMKLKKRILKDNILAGVRRARGITTLNINMPGDPQPVYVNEHLTVFNKTLLKNARATASSKQYEYTWTKNCQIYVRKNHEAKGINIRTEEDLKKIR